MTTPIRRLLLIAFLCANLVVAQSWAKQYDCIQLRVVGVCLWIICTPFGCNVDAKPKIGHFNPDVMVTVINPQGVDRVEDPKRIDTLNRNHNNLINQDALAVGHPLTGRFYCPSNTTAFSPYFAAQLDIPSWRWGGLDALHPAAWVPGLREIGNWPLSRWGNIYPRTGWTIQYAQPKAAAIVAHRVGDIITRRGQPHVYLSILGRPVFVKNNKLTWSPRSLIENSNQQGWWQPTAPKMEQCMVFGENDTLALRSWAGGRVSKTGDYVHALWRPYTCCEIGKGALVVIDFMPFPTPVIKN